jgi:hypothetical protein
MRNRNDRTVLEDAAAQGALEQRVGLYINRSLGECC